MELLLPYLYGIFIFLYWAIFSRSKTKSYRNNTLFGQYVILFITQQPVSVNVIFNFMKCKSLVTRSVVFNNPEISCT